MELDFTAEQEELRDAIRAVLTKESPIALARRVIETGARADELWSTFIELEWPSLTVPKAAGGIGLSAIKAAILAEELGRAVTPEPLLPTVTQFVPAIRECGTDDQRARWLGAVAAGECAKTLALDSAAAVTIDSDRAVLAETKRYVMEGNAVDEVVIVAGADVVVVPS